MRERSTERVGVPARKKHKSKVNMFHLHKFGRNARKKLYYVTNAISVSTDSTRFFVF